MINKRGSTHPFHFSWYGFPPFSIPLLKEKAATSLVLTGLVVVDGCQLHGIAQSCASFEHRPGLLFWPLPAHLNLLSSIFDKMGLSLLTKGAGATFIRSY